MDNKELIITKLEGYSRIRLLNNQPLTFKPGINLLVGRNGSGKSNLIHLINSFGNERVDLKSKIESSYFCQLAEEALKMGEGNPITKFGIHEIVNYRFRGDTGNISLSLNERVEKDYILRNIIQPGGRFHELIITSKSGPTFKVQYFNNRNSHLKLDIDSSFNSSPISKSSHDPNALSSTIEKQIGIFNEFFNNKLTEFLLSTEFGQQIKNLETLINDKLLSFLDNTNKRIELSIVSTPYPHVQSVLMDEPNEILPEYISAGESVLLNLVFTLSSIVFADFDVIAFDEPEQHMHDDMIRIFFNEINQISKNHPELIIVVASHSTALIEYISSLGKAQVNLIIFNNAGEVKNSDGDIDFINALTRNGVWFSPLMLSKKQNIFIENQDKEGFDHRDFFLKFFNKAKVKPNIIPIGNSGNVNQNDSFLSVFEDIMKTTNSRSIGIQDGDIWIKKYLTEYLNEVSSLDGFMKLIRSQEGQYIPGGKENQFHFNFWEIENLYLMDELLPYWFKNGTALNSSVYNSILLQATTLIAKQYISTFLKKVTHIRVENQNPEIMLDKIRSRLKEIESEIGDLNGLKSRTSNLIDCLIENRLWHWLPGKELKKHLENLGYTFDHQQIQFEELNISEQLTSVISKASV